MEIIKSSSLANSSLRQKFDLFFFSSLESVRPIVYQLFAVYDVQTTFFNFSKLQNTDTKTFFKGDFISPSSIRDVMLFRWATGDKLK